MWDYTPYVGIEAQLEVESFSRISTVKAIRQLTVIITYSSNDTFVRLLTAAIRQMITHRIW
jgi:hypothetical protein